MRSIFSQGLLSWRMLSSRTDSHMPSSGISTSDLPVWPLIIGYNWDTSRASSSHNPIPSYTVIGYRKQIKGRRRSWRWLRALKSTSTLLCKYPKRKLDVRMKCASACLKSWKRRWLAERKWKKNYMRLNCRVASISNSVMRPMISLPMKK